MCEVQVWQAKNVPHSIWSALQKALTCPSLTERRHLFAHDSSEGDTQDRANVSKTLLLIPMSRPLHDQATSCMLL